MAISLHSLALPQEIEQKKDIGHVVDDKHYCIIAPFLKNVLMKLLNDSGKMKRCLRIQHIRGLNKIKKCYNEWESMVEKASKITSIHHHIWRQFIHDHDETNQIMHDIHIIQFLFNQWMNADPTKQEMNQYMNITPIQSIYKSLHEAIHSGAFDDILHSKAMAKRIHDYSVVLCPLLTNIVQELLEIDANHRYFDDEWSEGLTILNECYPKWNEMVIKCVEMTPISHPIWKQLLNESEIKNKDKMMMKSDKQILKCLLSFWIHLKHKNKSYSVYPPTKTRQKYFRLKRINAILEHIVYGAYDDGIFDYYLIVSTHDIQAMRYIFGVFLKRIMSQLIHEALDQDEQECISRTRIRQCYPYWNKLIHKCCEITPIDHTIWREFIAPYSISNKITLTDRDVIKYQLDYFVCNDRDPSLNEQKKYTKLVIKPWCMIAKAVVQGTFDEAFICSKSEEKTKRMMAKDAYDNDMKQREETPLISDVEEENSGFNIFDSVPAPYSRTHRTLSLISYQSFASQEEFKCKICEKLCSDLDGIAYGDDESTFCCDNCVAFNLNPNNDICVATFDCNIKKQETLSIRSEKEEYIAYHMKEHNLFDIQLAPDSPFNYNRDKSLNIDWKDDIYNPITERSEPFEDDVFEFNACVDDWHFDVKPDANIADEIKSDPWVQIDDIVEMEAVYDEDEMNKTECDMKMIKRCFMVVVVVFCGIILMELYSNNLWIQFVVKLLSIIHFLSVCSVGIWLFLLWLKSVTDGVWVNDEEKQRINELFYHICDLTKALCNQYVFFGFGMFFLYLLIAFDNMLPSYLNVLNLISVGNVMHVLWMVYVAYLLYSLSH